MDTVTQNGELTNTGSILLTKNIRYSALAYPRIRIRNKEELRLLGGHLWAFSNELLDHPKDIEPGSVVTLVRERDGIPIGNGFYHPHSLIAFRLLTRNPEETIDAAFFERRIQDAASRRELLSTRRNAYRIVHGESDLLPGLIVDRFHGVISFQIVSAGFENRKNIIVELIEKIFQPAAIVQKNKSHLRTLEGLAQEESLVLGTDATTGIHDAGGAHFSVDVLNGQKTGFYLDQMENRTAIRNFIPSDARVLDLFTNEGGFAINAALGDASRIIAVDESTLALERLKHNAILNGVEEKISTVQADCFDYVRDIRDEFDLIVVDPPAMAKSKKDIPNARKGYLALNTAAIKRLKPNGVLITCSCSHHIGRDVLLEIVREAGRRAKRTVTLLEARGAGIDHPVLAAMPETEYLKVFFFRIL